MGDCGQRFATASVVYLHLPTRAILCTSGSCAFVVSRPVSPVPSASPVLVGGVGGSRVGFGVGVARGGVEGGLSHCFRFSAREMGGGAAPGSTNSWSDTAHACCPTGTLCTKGGVSGPAEDLLPVSEVEAGVNFRVAGGVRGSKGRCGHTFPPPGGSWYPICVTWTCIGHQAIYGLDEGVCGTARSGIWVLKGNARARMLPENLDHLRVRWISRGSYETAWVTPGHDCLCSYQYGHGAAVRPQTNDAIWPGVIGLCSPWCARREVPTGVNLNR